MPYEVSIREVSAWPIAAAHSRTTLDHIPFTVGTLLDAVWDFVGKGGALSDGHNVVIYSDVGPSGVTIDAGVRVLAPFPGTGTIHSLSTPAGLAATVTHVGPYEDLPRAHDAIVDWARNNQRALAGPSWELYGHWTDDPDSLVVEVFYLLAGG